MLPSDHNYGLGFGEKQHGIMERKGSRCTLGKLALKMKRMHPGRSSVRHIREQSEPKV